MANKSQIREYNHFIGNQRILVGHAIECQSDMDVSLSDLLQDFSPLDWCIGLPKTVNRFKPSRYTGCSLLQRTSHRLSKLYAVFHQ